MSGRARKTANPVFKFVITVGEPLKVQSSLLGTLAIDPALLRKALGPNSESRKFIVAAEDAWSRVRGEVYRGRVNPITWLQGLLIEARSSSLWFPAAFLLRLRQLQRRELAIEDGSGRNFERDIYAGLPQEFQEWAETAGHRFSIVPRIVSHGYENLDGGDRTEFVNTARWAWGEAMRSNMPLTDAVDFVSEKLKEARWTIS